MSRSLVVLLAVLHVGCSTTLTIGAGPYAGCVDLGDLTLTSSSRSDAEERMKARVLELGGDTLLFGERGRSAPLSDVPQEVTRRRNELLALTQTADGQAVDVGTTPTPEAQAAELWYYGAALRCSQRPSTP